VSGVYSVEGKLGTGKTKFVVWQAQMALLDGLRVASNVDLFLDKITPKQRSTFMRLPDKPTVHDLDAIGKGNDDKKYDEERFGILILDELGTWMNARSFQDKARQPVLDWLIHARKKRWRVYMLVQNSTMIDKQARESLIEYQCNCLRLDRVKIPFIGGMINDLSISIFGKKIARRWGYLPRMHIVAARVGEGTNRFIAERWIYRGDHLHACYDTEQTFSSDYPHGAHCVIPPLGWVPEKDFWAKLRERMAVALRKRERGVAQRPPLARPKRVVELLRYLPPDEALRHFRRLEGMGLL